MVLLFVDYFESKVDFIQRINLGKLVLIISTSDVIFQDEKYDVVDTSLISELVLIKREDNLSNEVYRPILFETPINYCSF